MNPEQIITNKLKEAVLSLYGFDLEASFLQTQTTRKEFEGDITAVMFPLLKISKKSPEETGKEIGNYILSNNSDIESFNVVKGFLNLKFSSSFWIGIFKIIASVPDYGQAPPTGKCVMVEFYKKQPFRMFSCEIVGG